MHAERHSSPERANRAVLWLILALTLIGFGIRSFALGAKNLRGDESFAAVFAHQSLAIIWHSLHTSEPHPPGYYFLLHWWIDLGGPSSFNLRYLSVLPAALCIPALAVAAGRVWGRSAAVLAALLATVNPLLVWQAQDARMYAQLEGASALTVTGMVLVLTESRSKRGLVLLGCAGVLTVLSHFYGLAVVAGAAAGLLAVVVTNAGTRRRALAGFLVLTAVALVVGIPFVVHGWPALQAHFPFPSLTPATLLLELGATAAGGLTLPAHWQLAVGLGAVGCSVGGAACLALRNRDVFLAVGGALMAPIALLLVLELLRPGFQAPYTAVIVCPLLLCWTALGAQPRVRMLMGPVVVCAATVVAARSLTVYARSDKNAQFASAAQQLLIRAGPDDVIVTNYPDPTLKWDYEEQLQGPLRVTLEPAFEPISAAQLDAAFQPIAQRYSRIWFWTLGQNSWDPKHQAERWLKTYTIQEPTQRLAGIDFRVFETPSGFLKDAVRLPQQTFDGQIQALAYTLSSPSVHAGQTLTVTVCWRVVQHPSEVLTAFVHLERDGKLYAQRDRPPLKDAVPTTAWRTGDEMLDSFRVPIPPATPPGRYPVVLGLYTSATVQRLTVLAASGEPVGTTVSLGAVTVQGG
ncbi:MAG: glycosyltransferase family 39 protein [Chloroflexi bacterium]|nr:glycosyltransferase family 39 protein [Chloroflexota bacterium]